MGQRARFYPVSVDRTTVYRVKATSTTAAYDAMTNGDGTEVDQTTADMRAEIDDDQTDNRVRQTACKFCFLDIENSAPFTRGAWRDRGGETRCNDNKHQHAPVPEAR